jgi:ATP-dependent helicase/nuclease subunit B
MQFYSVDSCANYLQSVAHWLVAKYESCFDSVKIFLPNTVLCQFLLQEISAILAKKGSKTNFLLPTFIAINNLDCQVFGVMWQNKLCQPATGIEQLLTLSKIVSTKQHYQISQTLDLASQLDYNFQELAQAGIDLQNLQLDPFIDKSIYLQQQLNLLSWYHSQLQQELLQHNKLTNYHFIEQVFSNYILPKLPPVLGEEAQEQLGNTIRTNVFIATTRGYKSFWQLIAAHLDDPNCSFVLPPIALQRLNFFKQEQDFLQFLQIEPSNITAINPLAQEGKLQLTPIIDALNEPAELEAVKNKLSLEHISLVETENDIEEANLILLLVKDFIDQNPGKSVAIVSSNMSLSKLIANNLQKHAIAFTDFTSKRLISTSICGYILSVARWLADVNNIDQLIILLGHPYLTSTHNMAFVNFIRQQKFINNLSQIDERIALQSDELKCYWQTFSKIVKTYEHIFYVNCNDFAKLLSASLEAAQILFPDLWHLKHDQRIINFFSDLLQAAKCIEEIKVADFGNLLKILISKERISNNSAQTFVNLLSVANIQYLTFDLLILADMNQGSWPSPQAPEIWLTNQLRSVLKLPSCDSILQTAMSDFWLLLCNRQVIITRAKKVATSTTLPSKFLQQLLWLSEKFESGALRSKDQYLQLLRHHLSMRKSSLPNQVFQINNFPKTISVSSMELLMRNPHGFFARNILKLYPVKELTIESMAAEFGIFIHSVIAIYNTLGGRFLNIAEQQIQKLGINNFLYKLWWPKICSIAKDYELFTSKRRPFVTKVYSEIAGQMNLLINNQQVSITAIADELLLDTNGQWQIWDYKTGALPTAKNVLSGLAPQLVLEGLILQSGGFAYIAEATPVSLGFTKIASSSPFLRQTVFKNIDFAQQLEGLRQFLQYYVAKNVSYQAAIPSQYASKYNDYKHFCRIDLSQ